ncbi:hypothetical protein [Asanoa siamensis]|uniref:DDE superfamily endonuclease n=1 Tax=Asanoa siamensis TaxID=926357 RepID=A0ABQ4D506_9ACTN|nr:hypothetical protein [Asanoa siamensis]GIF78591.1 hypothetical protein Asi02nite_81090 [Asanoa siamensis]
MTGRLRLLAVQRVTRRALLRPLLRQPTADSAGEVRAQAKRSALLVDGFPAPVPGARHDSKALPNSGIADRWASHLRPGGPGMLADLGYLGTAAITGTPQTPRS